MLQSEAEERIRAAGESSLLGRILAKSSNEIYVFDAQTLCFTQVNQGARDNLGYSMQELRNLTPLDLKPELSRQEFSQLIEPLRTGAKDNLIFQTVHRRKDGSTYPVEVRLQLSAAGQAPQFVAIIQDITERLRAEEESSLLGRILAKSSNEIYVFDAQTLCFTQVNQGARQNLGYSMQELQKLTPLDLKPELSREEFSRLIEPLRTGAKDNLIFQTVHRRKDGSTYPVEVRLQLSAAGQAPQFVAIIQDITERLRAEEESSLLGRILAKSSNEIYVFDAQTLCFTQVNQGARQNLGYSMQELQKLTPLDLKPELSREEFSRLIEPLSTGMKDHLIFETVHRRKDGSTYPVEVRLQLSAAGQAPQFVAIIQDITERQQAQAQMSKLSRALEHIADSVVITNRRGDIEYVNPAFELTTGYSKQEVIGKNPNIVNSGKHDKAFYKVLWDTILSGKNYRDVFINRKKDGNLYYEEKTIVPLKDEEGNITSFVATGKDITERLRAEERLLYMAHHDILTDLPNRALFIDRLSQAILRAHRSNHGIAVLFLDLDRFKVINETLGHDLGDRLLQDLAERLRSCLREADTIARLGGDEFAVLLEDITDVTDTSSIAIQVRDVLSNPFMVDGRELFITASVGISIFPDDGQDAHTLLKNADTAMHRAKESGRDTHQLYSAEMSTRALEQLTLETDLRHAVAREEFLLHYQPQVDLENGRIVGVEALIRWNHPELGLIPPDDFIPLLEETGLIIPVGEWVLRTACAQNKTWQDIGLPPLSVAVNLSGRQVDSPDLVEQVRDIVTESNLDPSYLELEITESMIMANVEATIETLTCISDMGITFAIDDFGTGYSSLSYLKRFPISTIKIDRSFVRDITTDPDDAAIVTTIIAMARNLKLGIIAEGVETEQQSAFLRAHGCTRIQGYLYSRPLPVEEITELLRQACPSDYQANWIKARG